jgi:alpha-L-rhamnosidase
VAGLEAFEAQHDGPYGTIVSQWRRVKEGVDYEVIIPPNSTATLYLPGRNISVNGSALDKTKEVKVTERSGMRVILQLPAGKYDFRVGGL